MKKSALIYETLTLPNEVIKALKKLEKTAEALALSEEASGWRKTREALEGK